MPPSEFDRYASTYDRDLGEALSVTGEGQNYYAQARVDWLASCLAHLKMPVAQVLDFGCGTGTSAPILKKTLGAKKVMGVDISQESIDEACSKYGSNELQFSPLNSYRPDGTFDLVFANGVFHHIPVADRAGALETIHASLKPGGLFALWENNPWNPGTKYVMSRCAFDGDAVTISIPAARKLMARARFGVLRTESLFYFPRQLRIFRPLERWLRSLPLGGQYMVLARRA